MLFLVAVGARREVPLFLVGRCDMGLTEGKVSAGGAVIFWVLSDGADLRVLQSEWGVIGKRKFVPSGRTRSSALKAAMEEVFTGRELMVRPLRDRDSDGWAVVEESHVGRLDNKYAQTCAVSPASVGVSVTPYGALDAKLVENIENGFEQHKKSLPASMLGNALVKVMESLGGTTLRPRGAIYWLQDARLSEWAEVISGVQKAGGAGEQQCFMIRHKMDKDAVQAVRYAICTEIKEEAEKIAGEVANGELGQVALGTREMVAGALAEKLTEYESILGESLDELRGLVDRVSAAAMTAKMQAMALVTG
jgi:hypothetical protein